MKKLLVSLLSALLCISVVAEPEIQSDGNQNMNNIGFSSYAETSKEYVDLGLPSGTLWATCNIGATKPEESGFYFAWGETMPKKIYDWSTYKWTKLNSEGDIDSLIRYNFNKTYGVVDSISTLFPKDDAAIVNLGKDWRMPTKEEIVELYENCKYCWTEINGVSGAKFTSSNGNSIFLPAAGTQESFVYNEGNVGYYWTSSFDGDTAAYVLYFYFHSEEATSGKTVRFIGVPIRPVRSKK